MICVCFLNGAVQVFSSCVRKLAKIKNMAGCKGGYCQLLHLKDWLCSRCIPLEVFCASKCSSYLVIGSGVDSLVGHRWA